MIEALTKQPLSVPVCFSMRTLRPLWPDPLTPFLQGSRGGPSHTSLPTGSLKNGPAPPDSLSSFPVVQICFLKSVSTMDRCVQIPETPLERLEQPQTLANVLHLTALNGHSGDACALQQGG